VKRIDVHRPNGPSYSENLLPKAIPLNYQMDFCRTSGKRSELLPVRFRATSARFRLWQKRFVCGSNGAFVRSRWISRSIHARSSRTVVASAILSLRMAAAFRYCGKHSCRARRWSFGCSRAISNACATVSFGQRTLASLRGLVASIAGDHRYTLAICLPSLR
jgi:hypothetical protein